MKGHSGSGCERGLLLLQVRRSWSTLTMPSSLCGPQYSARISPAHAHELKGCFTYMQPCVAMQGIYKQGRRKKKHHAYPKDACGGQYFSQRLHAYVQW